MAYSDYGGYAYRNGERVPERSDAVLTTEGVQSTPGMWPGWLIPEGRAGGSYHALLGDGPIHVGLYKQSSLSIHRLGKELDLLELAGPDAPTWEYEGRKYLDTDRYASSGDPLCLEVDGWVIEARFTDHATEDNHYLYVRVTQPDGVVWHGWSGYGVGAGLEDCGYGFDTDDREDTLTRFWPDWRTTGREE